MSEREGRRTLGVPWIVFWVRLAAMDVWEDVSGGLGWPKSGVVERKPDFLACFKHGGRYPDTPCMPYLPTLRWF